MNTFITIIAFSAAFSAFAAAIPANTGVALSNGLIGSGVALNNGLIGSELIASAPLASGYASAGWEYGAPSGIWANPGYPCPEGLSWAGQSGWANSIAFNGAGLNWGADLLAPSLIAQQAPSYVAQQAPTLIAQPALSNMGWGKGLPC